MERWLLRIGFTIACVNMAISFAIRVYFKGDASLGYVLDGHYFFGVPGHYTEVPQWLWNFSYRQIPILIGTQIVGIICALALWPPRWLRN